MTLDWYYDLHLFVKFFVLWLLAIAIMAAFGALINLVRERQD